MPTYGAASYGTAMPTYGASYGATPTYGGYGGGYGAHPMDAATVETQLKDATSVLTTQFGVQEKMLTHQHDAQMTAQATQYQMQVEMQAQMAKAYGSAYA